MAILMLSCRSSKARWFQKPRHRMLLTIFLVFSAALFFLVNPEIRLLLMWLDYIGLDLALLIFAFELRSYLSAARPVFTLVQPIRLLSLILPKISPSLNLLGETPRIALHILFLSLTGPVALVWSVGKVISRRGDSL
jgi:hypothetical protein